MLPFGFKKLPCIGYNYAMHRAVLILLVGLPLSLGRGVSALTFGKDGKQAASHEITDKETPPELLELIEPNNKLFKLSEGPQRKSKTGTKQDLIIWVVVEPIIRFRIRECP